MNKLLVQFSFLAAMIFAAHSVSTSAFGDDAVQSAFNSGKYPEALRLLQAHPSEDASYYYNLGTVLLKLQRTGQATAYLEKANRLQPHDIAIQQNLQLSHAALSQALGPEKLDPSSSWLENLADGLRLDEIRGAFGLVSFIIALFWIRSYLKTRRLRQTLLKPAGLLGIGALAITAGLYGLERVAGMNPTAVCIDRVSVRSGPGDSYIEVSHAEAGTKLRALGPTSEGVSKSAATSAPSPTPSESLDAQAAQAAVPQLWRQVRYSLDGIGWVRASSVLLL